MNKLWNMIRYKLFASKEEQMFGDWYVSLRESAIEWNVTTLKDNTLIMQIRKVLEEIEEVLEAVETNPENKVKERYKLYVPDVTEKVADGIDAEQHVARLSRHGGGGSCLAGTQPFVILNDKGIKEILIAANDKINELYKREYEIVDGVYRHKEKPTTIN